MRQEITIRLPARLLTRAEAKAARLGLDRERYVRRLIERDVASGEPAGTHKFASEDLVGCLAIGQGPYTNQRIRELIRTRWLARREKNR